MTESSIVLTAVLHHDAQATGVGVGPLHPQSDARNRSPVLCPCRATSIAERKNSIPIRKEMRAFQGIIAEESQNPGGQVGSWTRGGVMRELADMTSMELRMYQSMLADAHVREPMVKVVESR